MLKPEEQEERKREAAEWMFLRATEHNMRGRGGSDGEQEERRERRRASSSGFEYVDVDGVPLFS